LALIAVLPALCGDWRPLAYVVGLFVFCLLVVFCQVVMLVCLKPIMFRCVDCVSRSAPTEGE